MFEALGTRKDINDSLIVSRKSLPTNMAKEL